MKKSNTPKGETTNNKYYQLYPSVVQEGFRKPREVYVMTAVLSNLNLHNKEMVLRNEQGIDYHFKCNQNVMYNFLGMTQKTFERGIKDLEAKGYFTHISKHKPKSIFQTSYFLMTEKGLSLFKGTRKEAKTIEVDTEEIDNVLPFSEGYYPSIEDFDYPYYSSEEIIMNPFIDDTSIEVDVFPFPEEYYHSIEDFYPYTSPEEIDLNSFIDDISIEVDDVIIEDISSSNDVKLLPASTPYIAEIESINDSSNEVDDDIKIEDTYNFCDIEPMPLSNQQSDVELSTLLYLQFMKKSLASSTKISKADVASYKADISKRFGREVGKKAWTKITQNKWLLLHGGSSKTYTITRHTKLDKVTLSDLNSLSYKELLLKAK